MVLTGWVVLMTSWFAWWYPLIFRAPHNQKRASITLAVPTGAGLFLECVAIFIAFVCRSAGGVSWWRLAGTIIFGPPSATLSWASVRPLGRQVRINAGVYDDHQLVMTCPYAT